MLAPGPHQQDPSDLGRLDFGVRCTHCKWRVLGMDVVHVGADGALPQEKVKSRDGSRTAIVIRSQPPTGIDGVRAPVCKGWATPALCNSCGALVAIRGLRHPPGIAFWKRFARKSTCPRCNAKGVLPFPADGFAMFDVIGLPVPLAAVGGALPWRLFPTAPTGVNLALTVVLGLGLGTCGYLLAGLRWMRGQRALQAWFAGSRCPQCKAVGLAQRRDLGQFGCMAGDDPFADWPIDRLDADEGPDWKAFHLGRDRFLYEERVGKRWERLEIEGEMLSGTPHHVIYFDPPENWASYPGWARDRRTVIIARLKEAFPQPDYAYEGEVVARGSSMVDVIRENARLVAQTARKELGTEVVYDEADVRWLDAFIQAEHDRGRPANRPGLVSTLGAFLGECVIRTHGGAWASVDGDWAIRFDDRNVVYPFRKVEKHLANGRSDSVLSFFTLIPSVFTRQGRQG